MYIEGLDKGKVRGVYVTPHQAYNIKVWRAEEIFWRVYTGFRRANPLLITARLPPPSGLMACGLGPEAWDLKGFKPRFPARGLIEEP